MFLVQPEWECINGTGDIPEGHIDQINSFCSISIDSYSGRSDRLDVVETRVKQEMKQEKGRGGM